MSEKDKIVDALEAVSNPLSAAKNTVSSARGLVKETYGLVEDVREIAAKEKAHQEKAREERQIEGAKAKVRITKRVGDREVNKAVLEHNAAVTASESAAKAALIRQRQAEEEHALVWSMSSAEREAYYAEKKKQIEQIKQEKLRLIREENARQERNDMIVAVIATLITMIIMVWGFFLWLHYMTGSLLWVPGASWIRGS